MLKSMLTGWWSRRRELSGRPSGSAAALELLGQVRYAKALAPVRQEHRARMPHDRIRLGYVSPDFRNHAVGRLVEPALKHHDRDQFAVYCYSDVTQPDERTGRFRSYAAAMARYRLAG